MGPDAADAVESLRATWPKSAVGRLDEVLRTMRGGAPAPLAAAKDGIPETPADVDAKAREILEKYRNVRTMRSPDPNVDRLVDLGRPVLGTLIRVLSDSAAHDAWAIRQVAQGAIGRIARDEDVPMLARLMRSGHKELEAAFAGIQGPSATSAVAALVKEGAFYTRLDALLEGRVSEPAVIDACTAWLRHPVYEGDRDFAIAKMADVLSGGDRSDVVDGLPPGFDDPGAVMFDAAPALFSCLALELRAEARRRVGAALVRLGDKRGFPVLIEALVASDPEPRGPDDYSRWAAGKQLEKVSGIGAFRGESRHGGDAGGATWTGNFAEAAPKFRKWWDASKDKLVFDRATRKWSVR
jgi:hypothetical protein